MISKTVIDKALEKFIKEEKECRLSNFRYYTSCRRIYGSMHAALKELNLTDLYQENKYNTNSLKNEKIKHTNVFLKEQIEKFYNENDGDVRASEFKYYQTLVYRFKSFENAIKKLDANVIFKKTAPKFEEKVSDFEIKNDCKNYLISKVNGNENARFARRTLAMYRYGSTQKALETLELWGLDLFAKIKIVLENRKIGKMSKKEQDFVEYLSVSIDNFVKKNY